MRPLPFAVLFCLAGCALPDQRLFNPHAGEKPARKSAALVAHAEPVLLRISYRVPNPDYRAALTGLVQKALARKNDALFTVTALVPLQDGAGQQAEDDAAAAVLGQEVAQAIVDAGAAPGQVVQAIRADKALSVTEVTVGVH